jgi:hypothetical protein
MGLGLVASHSWFSPFFSIARVLSDLETEVGDLSQNAGDSTPALRDAVDGLGVARPVADDTGGDIRPASP